jgi:hypothetical protein
MRQKSILSKIKGRAKEQKQNDTKKEAHMWEVGRRLQAASKSSPDRPKPSKQGYNQDRHQAPPVTLEHLLQLLRSVLRWRILQQVGC